MGAVRKESIIDFMLVEKWISCQNMADFSKLVQWLGL